MALDIYELTDFISAVKLTCEELSFPFNYRTVLAVAYLGNLELNDWDFSIGGVRSRLLYESYDLLFDGPEVRCPHCGIVFRKSEVELNLAPPAKYMDIAHEVIPFLQKAVDETGMTEYKICRALVNIMFLKRYYNMTMDNILKSIEKKDNAFSDLKPGDAKKVWDLLKKESVS